MQAVELTKTPGTYYALAYWLGTLLYIMVNPRKLFGWKLVGTLTAGLMAVAGVALMTRDVPICLFFPAVMAEFGLCLIMLLLCCDVSLLNGVYFFIRGIMLGEFAASFEWQMYYYAITVLGVPDNAAVTGGIMILMHGAVFGLVYCLERRYVKGNQQLKVNRKELITAVMIFVMVFALSNMSYAVEGGPFSSPLSSDLFIIRTVSDLGGVGILFFYHVQLQELTSRLELEQLNMIAQMQYNNYKVSENNIAIINQKYHDLKHQIEWLRYEVTSEEKRKYLAKMERELRSFEAEKKTGNRVLDAILTGKSLECQHQGITLTSVVDGAALEFMHPADLSALFGNMLDNAIEGTVKVPEQEQRLIHVSASRQNQFIKIRIRNSCVGKTSLKNGVPVTTKKDKNYHGYGIKSMKRIVHEYEGTLTLQVTEGWFEVDILIPLPEKQE